MKLASLFRSLAQPPAGDPRDLIASLLLAAKSDTALREQVLYLLRAPTLQRQSLINSALHEMQLRGEPAPARAAFALLSSDEGAQAALKFLTAR